MMVIQRKKMNRKKKIVTGVEAKIWLLIQFEKKIFMNYRSTQPPQTNCLISCGIVELSK